MADETFYYYPNSEIPAFPFVPTLSGTVNCDGTYRHERDYYPYYIFEYILSGRGTLEINSVSYRPEKGDIYIVHKGRPHKYYSDAKDPWRKIWFTATGPLISQLMMTYNLNNVFCMKGPGLLRHFENMQVLLKSRDPELQKKSTLVFHELMFDMYTILSSFDQARSSTAFQIKDYIDNNLESRITLKDICNSVYKSPSQVIRIFKKSYGTTPYGYLLNRRIGAAKLLLQGSDYSIKEIAHRMQFADEHYFSNVFKTRTGTTPTEFRDMIDNNCAPVFLESPWH